MRGRTLNVIAIVTAATVGIGACGGDQGGTDDAGQEAPASGAQTPATGAQGVTLADGVTQEQFDMGREIFTGQGACQACHGPDATGTALAPNLTDDEWLNISGPNRDEIIELIKTGVPQPEEHPAPMPPMGGANLTDAQIQAVADYIASIGQG